MNESAIRRRKTLEASQRSGAAPYSVERTSRQIIQHKLMAALEDGNTAAALLSKQDLEDLIFACELWTMRDGRARRLGNMRRGMEQLLREAFPPNRRTEARREKVMAMTTPKIQMQRPPAVASSDLFSPTRLIVSAEVRYWEDAKINGEQDTEDGTRIPLKVGSLWKPIIELETGRVLEWPQGTMADIHYKVCDQGEYWIEDADGERLKWKGSYVPSDLLCVGGNGYGDYIILKISAAGIIEGWQTPTLDTEDWENNGGQR